MQLVPKRYCSCSEYGVDWECQTDFGRKVVKNSYLKAELDIKKNHIKLTKWRAAAL